MATLEKHGDAQKTGHLAPELRLSTLIQVNTDMNFATVVIRGSLTQSNCDALIRIVVRTSYLAPNLKITIDLSGARLVDRKALKRLEIYPSWTVIGPVQKTAVDGQPDTQPNHLGVGSNWHASYPTSPQSVATHEAALLAGEADGSEYVHPADPSRIAPEEPFPEDLTILEQFQLEVLNSRTHRQLDIEYIRDAQPHPETSARLEELTEELDRIDNQHDLVTTSATLAASTKLMRTAASAYTPIHWP
ncbi:hypothetical protein [Arthrobacter sp. HLT1-21]